MLVCVTVAVVATVLLFIVNTPLAISASCATLIFGMVAYLLRGVGMRRTYKFLVLGGILLGNVFLAVYTHFQRFIPFWDYAGYYIETLRSATLMREDLPGFFAALYDTMLQSDYTKLPTLFTAPILEMLGGSFTAYIFTIYNLFIVPFYCVFSCLVYKINKKFVWLIFLFTPFLNPALRGYLDAAGLIYISVWLAVVYRQDFQKIELRQDILLGLLSVLLVFTRRWYLFFLVAAFAALLLSGLIRKIYDKEYKIKMLLYNILICGGTTLIIVLLFFRPYLVRLFGNRMSDAYSAYMFGDFWWNVKYFISYYGVLPFLFFALGLFGLCRERMRQFTCFLILQLVIMFFLFTRIQTIGYHHQYLFAANLFLLAAVGISSLPYGRQGVLAAWCLVLCVSFLYIYIPGMPGDTLHLLSTKRFVPKTADTAGIISLRDKINEKTEAENATVYILSSSEALNDDILKNTMLPTREDGIYGLLGTAHVDKRDGFPNHFLVAKYIVVADPVQVHLGEENQQVVAFLAREILDGTYTQNLTKIETVQITKDIKAHIYRRDSGYSVAFLDRLRTHFETIYPEHPFLYAIDYIWSQN